MFECIYTLSTDKARLKLFAGTPFGPDAHWFSFPFGLVGSDTWWNAITTGEMETYIAEGVVTKYIPHGEEHGQYAHFEISEGETTSDWLAHGEEGDLRLYRVGDRLKIKYVLHSVLSNYPGRKELVLEIIRSVR